MSIASTLHSYYYESSPSIFEIDELTRKQSLDEMKTNLEKIMNDGVNCVKSEQKQIGGDGRWRIEGREPSDGKRIKEETDTGGKLESNQSER